MLIFIVNRSYGLEIVNMRSIREHFGLSLPRVVTLIFMQLKWKLFCIRCPLAIRLFCILDVRVVNPLY